MRTSENTVLVIGAGMSGLLAALLVKKRQPRAQVVIVEHSDGAGGDYRGFTLDGFGYCDRAMRVIYETGFPEFDELLHGLLPEAEWHVLPDNQKDVVGLYWRGGLQTNCQYIDLRRLPEDVRRQCEAEINRCVTGPARPAAAEDAASHVTSRFGRTAGGLLATALQKLYRAPADELHRSATIHPAMNRVVLYNEDRMPPVLRDDALRAVIAWPQQLTFPLRRLPPQAGLYPRRFGMNGVIDAAVRQLRARGATLLLNRRVVSLVHEGEAAKRVTLDDGTVLENPALIIAANGLHASLALLRGSEAPVSEAPRAPRHWLVFFRTQTQPAMGRLYHFFCYDERFRAFRVTSYANYCPAARTEAGYPLCVELWSNEPTAADATARSLDELQQMGILEPGSVTAQTAVPLPNVHALASLECVQHLRATRNEVRERSPKNMITVGPFMEDGVMLLFEVWRKMYPLLAERIPVETMSRHANAYVAAARGGEMS